MSWDIASVPRNSQSIQTSTLGATEADRTVVLSYFTDGNLWPKNCACTGIESDTGQILHIKLAVHFINTDSSGVK